MQNNIRNTMKAIIFRPQQQQWAEITLPTPKLEREHDLLIEVKAISVNPVDTKLRRKLDASTNNGQETILGFDAAGIVVAVNNPNSRFRLGDQVYYAGDVTRAGSNAEYQLVDERIVAHKPDNLSFAEAAALPLTAITAYEGLFDRLRLTPSFAGTILIIAGAGGVGSMAIQLLKQITDAKIIATASRSESIEYCRQLGAHLVVNHQEVANLPEVDAIFCLSEPDPYFEIMSKIIRPQGLICGIVDFTTPVNFSLLKNKCAGFVWEFMFARSKFNTPDIADQGRLLAQVAELIMAEKIKTTLQVNLGKMTAANMQQAHALLESKHSMGKVVLEF